MPKLLNIEDLPQDWNERIISLGKDQGMGVKEICSELGISVRAHVKFKKENEQYAEAFVQSKEYAEAWWMTQGRTNLMNKGFNVGVYAFNMKNRFQWRDTPLIVAGNERKLADAFEEAEVEKKYKKKEVHYEEESSLIN